MDSTRSPTPRPRLTIGRVMLGIASLAALIGLAILEPKALVISFFVGINVLTFVLTRPSRKAPPRAPRKFRFSLWQVMAGAAFMAAVLAIIRALSSFLIAANPTQGEAWAWSTAGLITIGFFAALAFVAHLFWSVIRLFLVGSKVGRREGHHVRALQERTLGEDPPESVPSRVVGDPHQERPDL